MTSLLILVVLVSLAVADDPDDTNWEYQEDSNDEEVYYHQSIGIPIAEMIREAEGAMALNDDWDDMNDVRIIGGTENPVGASPHAVGLFIKLTDGNFSVCGACMLSNTRAVTAAHCWNDGEHQAFGFICVFGSEHLYYGGTRIKTTNVTMHENYDNKKRINDLAMISYDRVEYTDVIKKIDLPTDDMLKNKFNRVWAEVVGYGRNFTGARVHYHQPQRIVRVKVIGNKKCKKVYGNKITNSHICTRGGPITKPVGTCGGDSGGPLTTEVNGTKFLIGVVQGGNLVCEKHPSVYSRVTAHIAWIKAKM